MASKSLARTLCCHVLRCVWSRKATDSKNTTPQHTDANDRHLPRASSTSQHSSPLGPLSRGASKGRVFCQTSKPYQCCFKGLLRRMNSKHQARDVRYFLAFIFDRLASLLNQTSDPIHSTNHNVQEVRTTAWTSSEMRTGQRHGA